MEKTMSTENILNSAIEGIKSGMNSVENKYDSHIREKAIKEVSSATAQNMIALLVPSHRAISNDNMTENMSSAT